MMRGRTVNLRYALNEDIETIIPMTMDEEICRLLYGSKLRSKNEQKAFIKNLIDRQSDNFPYTIFLLIETKAGKPIGFVNLHSIDWKNGNIINDMAITDRPHRGRGAAVETVALMTSFVFNELNMRKFIGNIYDFNGNSLSLYKRMSVFGLVQEGTLRSHSFKSGGYHDVQVFSILKEDYEKYASTLNKLAGIGEK